MSTTPSLPLRIGPALVFALALLSHAFPAGADVMPTARRTTWNPGIPGGIPVRTTVCATINASTYGNGTQDATSGIQSAINACPVGQVVQLSAGDFLINGSNPLFVSKGITLRGMGPTATKLRKTSTSGNPLIVVGERWPQTSGATNLTANAPKGATSVQVASTAGLTAGRLVMIDEITDPAYVYWGPNCQPGAQCRGWFSRSNRPVGQMLEVASVNGNTVTFTTPLHIGFQTAQTAQLVTFTGSGVRNAGLEDLYVRGGREDNVILTFAMYSWVKNVESDWSTGDSFAVEFCFRCVLRDSYAHDTPDPNPGGAGYMLSVAWHTSDSLIENNIFMRGNKVMVMRASGGGNVVGYNYFEDGYIGYDQGWMETGMNASHMTTPHFELFEGNQGFNIDGDNSWGGAYAITYFRNHATGKRRSFSDQGNRRAIGLMYGHYDYSFVGNVLGTANQNPAPYSGFAYEDFFPWNSDPIGLWRLGYNPENWNAPADTRVVESVHRHANWDYATDSNDWENGYDTTLPNSLYLTQRPPFFGNLPWPWVDATGATKLFTLPARARFDSGNPNGTVTLSVVKQGSGSGTVTSSPAGINCGASCTASYPSGTAVTLTAAPASGSTFAGWGGACSGTGTCQVTMSASQAVTATFNSSGPSNHVLTVTRAGTGTGTVTSTPAGINCGATCSASYASGTVVTLSAAAASGSTFAGWGGACSGTGACQVTMSAAQAVTATFNLSAPTNHVLTVTRAGTGTGTVTSSPAGINCGATCSASYASGTVVTLSAAAASGSTFAGWSGACSGTGACQVTMSAARAVTATFNVSAPTNHVLTVTRAGTGTGTVTSSPAGINCGTTCSASYASGTVVTLSAAAASGSTFAGWSGACSGTGACQVTMSAARAVTATFTSIPPPGFVLTVTRAGTGTGTVTSAPAGISCGATCSATYAAGTVVTLTASPAGGSTFTGWSGACTGTGSCQVTMSAARAVTATFGGTSAGPVAAWGFDDASGNVARDSSPNGNDGTLVNGPTWTTGRHGGALLFDGVDDRVRVNDSNSLDLGARATLSAWVYPTVQPVSYRTIVQKEDNAYYLAASGLNRYEQPGNRPYGGGSLNDQCCYSVVSNGQLPVNTWTHIAVTYNGARMRFFVNGVQVSSRTATGPFEQNAQPLWIGGHALYNSPFQGKIDDVRIYNRSLTAIQIQEDMAGGAAQMQPDMDAGADQVQEDLGAGPK